MKKEIADNLLALVKRGYNEIAVDFDQTRKKELGPQLRELAAAIPDGARILDVGCGNGRLASALAGKKINYLGIDNSEELIKLARQNYPQSEFLLADILDLKKVGSDKFDYIFCLAVLPHLSDQERRVQALRQMSEKLETNGQIIISIWNLWQNPKYRPLLFKNYWLKIWGRLKWESNDLVFPWKNSRGEIKGDRYYHAFTRQELKRIIKLAGLEIESFFKDRHNFWIILKNKT